jgi:hypothetical protein
MNVLYTFLIVGGLTSILVAFGLLYDSPVDIKSVTRTVENQKSVYDIDVVKNKIQSYDIIVNVNAGKVVKINDTL